jgi:hypothetical protein
VAQVFVAFVAFVAQVFVAFVAFVAQLFVAFVAFVAQLFVAFVAFVAQVFVAFVARQHGKTDPGFARRRLRCAWTAQRRAAYKGGRS